MVLATVLLFSPVGYAQPTPSTPPTLALNLQELVKRVQKPNEDVDVLQPLHAAQKIEADKLAADALEAARQAEEVSQEAAIVGLRVSNPAPASGDLLVAGGFGYSLGWGNCVDVAHEYGKNQPGNPISWVPTTQTPAIGEAALFYFNHVSIISGIWSDGSIEVYQANSPDAPHRYPRSEFRGFF